MAEQRLGIIMHGVTGRMGYNQHLVRSILAIRDQGGITLKNGDRLMVDPIIVGRNARQNDQITFTLATAADVWLHARDVPGAHVIIRSGGQPVDQETQQAAAQLAAYYSKRRGDHAVPVAITPRRFVTRVPGGRPGQVHIRQEETIVVPAELPEGVTRK